MKSRADVIKELESLQATEPDTEAGYAASNAFEVAIELVQQLPDDDWQPIATAPRDGTHIIVWPPTYTGTTSVARYDDDKHSKKPRPYWERMDTNRIHTSRDKPPTHWRRPLAGP